MQRGWRRLAGVPWPDLLIGLVLVAAALLTTVSDDRSLHPLTELVSVVVAASVVLRTLAPLVMVVVVSAGILVLAALPAAETPLWAFAALLIVAFSITDHLRGVRMVAAVCVLLAAVYVMQVRTSDSVVETVLTPPILIGAPAIAGWLLARSRRQSRRLRELTDELVASRAKVAALAAEAERARLVRDLHDMLGHTLSSIAVQAGAAGELLSPDHPAAEPIDRVRQAAHEGLDEVRAVLSRGPERLRGVERIPALVDDAGAVLRVSGEPPVLPAECSTEIFRIVQEALTNVRRHASDSRADVAMRYSTTAVDITVSNPLPSPPPPSSTGRGLIGMSERAAAYGGTAEAGFEDGRWTVRAHIPLDHDRGESGGPAAAPSDRRGALRGVDR